MPLTEQEQFNTTFYTSPAATHPQAPPHLHSPQPDNELRATIQTLITELDHTNQRVALQREVTRRVSDLDEGDYMALEKQVSEELFKPKNGGVSPEDVSEMIQGAIQSNNQAINQLLEEHNRRTLQLLQEATRPRTAPPEDPMGTAPEPLDPDEEEQAKAPPTRKPKPQGDTKH